MTQLPSIKGFSSIKECGVISSWPKGKIEFGRYNIFYGWNGTGKTTLSRIFRSLEIESLAGALSKNAFPSFQMQLSDSSSLDSGKLSGWKSRVRVFNKDFIKGNVQDDGNDLAPVFYLGAEQGDAHKNQKKMLEDQQKNKDLLFKAETTLNNHSDAYKTKVRDTARVIRDTLGLPNFKANSLKEALDDFISKDVDFIKLIKPDSDLDALINASRGTNDKSILELHKIFENKALYLYELIEEILGRNITIKALDELDKNPTLKKWVDEGHSLHKDRTNCALCASKISESRKADLADYFNDSYKALQLDISEAIEQVQSSIITSLPYSEEQLFPLAKSDYKTHSTKYSKAVKDFNVHLNSLISDLEKKKLDLSPRRPTMTDTRPFTLSENIALEAVASLNESITKHNNIHTSFETSKKSASDAVVKHYVASFYAEYKDALKLEESLIQEIMPLSQAAEQHAKDLKALDILLSSHDIALPRLNLLLQSFIGRSDITLELHETGYHVKRGNELAENLSEGERTAIAFTYFIAKMEEKDFNIKESIVVIDDPISSLDSNALYAAGSFIRLHLEEAQQLFILTHNHQFFREMQGWVKSLKVTDTKGLQAHKGYFILNCESKDGKRVSVPSPLGKLLLNYDSEYVFLCSLLFESSSMVLNADDQDQITKLVSLPTAARRVLETFLLFKFPDLANGEIPGLFKNIKKLGVEGITDEMASVLDRLLNRASHGDDARAVTFNMLELSETPKAIKYVLDFIRAADSVHYTSLARAIGVRSSPTPAAAAA